MIQWKPYTQTYDTFESCKFSRQESRRYVVGDREPHYPVPVIVVDVCWAKIDCDDPYSMIALWDELGLPQARFY